MHSGVNVLAVGVWNSELDSTDLVLWPELYVSSESVDNCPFDANANQADADGDNVGDVCDNCPNAFNPAQTDADGDGAGNACDP
jgi:hypothetical protein